VSERRKILEITSYPPPRAGWGMRVETVKRGLQARGHDCRVLNTGISRKIPSTEYETVLSGFDYIRKVWRFSRDGYVCHVHVNGKSPTGLALALVAELLNVACGSRCYLTFHAGEEQKFFPKSQAPLLAPLFRLLFTIPRSIICNSGAVKLRIEDYGIDGRKIAVIPAFSRQYLDFERAPLGEAVEQFYRDFSHVLFCYINLQGSYHPAVLLDAFATIGRQRQDVGLFVCGLMGHADRSTAEDFHARIARYDMGRRVCLVDDLDHDQFLTAMTRSSMYVRTPPADGVASSVLEALALRIPVVASENGSRPAGVVTYEPTNAVALATRINQMLDRRDEAVAAIPPTVIADTLEDEIRLLTSQ
jgi:glycosyltransferase involved in cell wall biosynthesis